MVNLKLPKLFQSGMVLQTQNPRLHLGHCAGREPCCGFLAGYTAYAVAVDESFRTYLPPMEAGSGYTLSVSAHGKTIHAGRRRGG
jgi:hypothetical protein